VVNSETAATIGDPVIVDAMRAAIEAAGGQITFAHFMDLALYHPERGYYLAAGRRPGRGGDFLTAPETHPFFGMTLARQIAECWERLGRPDPFVVREIGAGIGGLAYDIIAGLTEETPAILASLRYQLVEANPHRRIEAMAAMREVGLDRIVAAIPPPVGEWEPLVGVTLANEVADAFPVHRLIWRGEATAGEMRERHVRWMGDRFAEVEGDLSQPVRAAGVVAALRHAGVTLVDGAAYDVSPAAAAWFAALARGLARGYAIVIDYGYQAATLYSAHRLAGTLRAYAGHTVSDDPFCRVGEQDLTAHVDFTALERAGLDTGLTRAGFTNQGAMLASLGLGEWLTRLQRDPDLSAPEYLATRAAVLRLIDPGGMGRFGVLMMARDAPVEPPLRAFAERGPTF